MEDGMHRLAVIADDLTGAMDTGVQFSKRGLETVVLMSGAELPAPGHRLFATQVLVIDTDSRAVAAPEAYRRMAAVVNGLGGRRLYKKVDSTMRGNVGYELRALGDAAMSRRIVVAPAYPPGGRTTLHGRQRVHGKPLELTFFARDPRWPMHESHLPTLLMQQSGREVGQVDVEVVQAGPIPLARALRQLAEPIVVVDALEPCHLCTLGLALAELGEGWTPCGSAGLAEEWVAALGLVRESVPPRPSPCPLPVLVVSGSRNEVSLAQIERATVEQDLARVDLDPYRCYDADVEAERLAVAARQAMALGRDVVLTSSFAPLVAGMGDLVARVLAGAVARVVSRGRPGGLFLTGGDVAVAVSHALGAQALRIAAEVQPGIPGGQLVGGSCDGLWVVTKAGGFGDEGALGDALAYLHGEPEQRTSG
jgi:uncharacterized protein YgbK (DUF1537 family)